MPELSAAEIEAMTLEEQVEYYRGLNTDLKEKQNRSVYCKVSEKGGVSVYGLGRFPVTLYKDQWNALFDMAEMITDFIEENQDKLSKKADKNK